MKTIGSAVLAVAVLVAGILFFSTSALAAGMLNINSMADITKYCPYDSGTRTYSCTGWDNIYVQNDISLPFVNPSYGRRWGTTSLWRADPTNIIFKANNEFSAKNFYATNPGGYGGSITIGAKKITAASLNAYGTACNGSKCTSSGPFCSNSNGGDVTLNADSVTVGMINANQGGGAGGSGGKVSITASSTTITNIYSSGGGYTCSYDYGYDNGAGTGGTVSIKSGTASLSSISLNGAGRNYASAGTAGGSARISSGSLNLGTITANGGGPSRSQGAGGNIKIFVDTYSLGSISALKSGGYIAFFTDAAYPAASKLGAATIKTGKRTGSGFFVFETNIPSQYVSYRARLKDFMGQYVKSIYNAEWSQVGAIRNGKISDFMGAMTKMNIKIGNDYTLELTASPDAFFDETKCAGRCATYAVPFNVY